MTRERRPPCASRTALIDALEGSLGVSILRRTIADIEQGACQPIEQPKRSPTGYARALVRHGIATAVPLASLDMTRCQDLICYLGESPPGWLALDGWRRKVRWRPGRLVDADAASPLDDSKWQCVCRRPPIGLRREGRVLRLRPFPRLAGRRGTPAGRSAGSGERRVRVEEGARFPSTFSAARGIDRRDFTASSRAA